MSCPCYNYIHVCEIYINLGLAIASCQCLNVGLYNYVEVSE